MFLESGVFATVVENTPLVSIDLVVRNSLGQVLTGMRVNRPAQGYWFVPGGRVAKDEALAVAFSRIARDELGVEVLMKDARFLGVYEHFYDDNFGGDGFSTHYVVLGYEFVMELGVDELSCDQHSLYRWFDVDTLLSKDDVHVNTKGYF